MNWYYSDGGRQMGPVSEEEFQRLAASGTIQPATLVWREGMPEWQPFSRAVGPAGIPPVAGEGIVCSVCRQSFKEDEVIRYEGQYVCAACKPIFLQRLKEGATPEPTFVHGTLSIEELLNRDYQVQLDGVFKKAWKTLNFKLIAATALMLLLSGACGVVPFVGFFVQLALQGALWGGVWMAILKQIRTQDAEVGDVFGGFGPRYLQLMLVNVAISVVSMLCMLPFSLAFGLAVPLFGKLGSGDHYTPALALLMVLAAVVLVFFSVCWTFAVPLAADKGLPFWSALELSRKIVTKHWGSVFGALILSGICGMWGIVGCGIGILGTIPLTYIMMAYIYEDIFGALMPVKAA